MPVNVPSPVKPPNPTVLSPITSYLKYSEDMNRKFGIPRTSVVPREILDEYKTYNIQKEPKGKERIDCPEPRVLKCQL